MFFYSTEDLAAADIVSELSANITGTSYSRFNINRGNGVWDGAVRGFKRASFDPSHEISVKFTDDEGRAEDGLDNGGPKREFLTLLMNPRFLSEMLYQHLTGRANTAIVANIEDITDDTMKASLLEFF